MHHLHMRAQWTAITTEENRTGPRRAFSCSAALRLSYSAHDCRKLASEAATFACRSAGRTAGSADDAMVAASGSSSHPRCRYTNMYALPEMISDTVAAGSAAAGGAPLVGAPLGPAAGRVATKACGQQRLAGASEAGSAQRSWRAPIDVCDTALVSTSSTFHCKKRSRRAPAGERAPSSSPILIGSPAPSAAPTISTSMTSAFVALPRPRRPAPAGAPRALWPAAVLRPFAG